LSSATTKSHFAQAKRELTGVLDEDPNDVILESAPESERWDPVAHSSSLQAFRCHWAFSEAKALLNFPWGEHLIAPAKNSGLQLPPDGKQSVDQILPMSG
jgi:hypothetical protein